MGDHILFCYGTLMAPQMLHRVIHGSPNPEPWQKALIRFQPAVLHGYRRHRVRGADYPGIVAETAVGSTHACESTSSGEATATTVLGVLVYGLTDGDMYRLDQYEGSEYVKETVKVRTLCGPAQEAGSRTETTPEGHLKDILSASGSWVADEGEEVLASTYVWIAGRDRLEEEEWDFETFKQDKLAWWISADESEW